MNIIEQVSAFLRRFVYLQDPKHYRLIATWIIASHLYQEFDYTGYLVVTSPEPECGKSRLLEIIQRLCYKSSEVLISPTEAIMFRTAEQGTQVLDEVDTWLNIGQLKAVLNAGYRKGASVPRLVEVQNNGVKSFEPKNWPCYAPRVLGGISLADKLPDTTLSRSFIIPMVRRKSSERGEHFRLRKVEPELRELHTAIETWAANNRAQVVKESDRDFPILEAFNDRTIDITEPLMAVTVVACQGLDRVSAEIELVDSVAALRQEKNTYGLEHKVLASLFRLAELESPIIGNASELRAKCLERGIVALKDIDESVISATLRKYGYEPQSKRIDGGEAKRRFMLDRESLLDKLERFGCGTETDLELPLGEQGYHMEVVAQ